MKKLSLLFALALSPVVACRTAQDLEMRAVPASVISAPVDCQPLVQRCAVTRDGVVPVVCSPLPVPGTTYRREWAMLPLRPDGTHRVCAYGCVVDADGGIAHCTGVPADASPVVTPTDASVEGAPR